MHTTFLVVMQQYIIILYILILMFLDIRWEDKWFQNNW